VANFRLDGAIANDREQAEEMTIFEICGGAWPLGGEWLKGRLVLITGSARAIRAGIGRGGEV
jgi:hypothetical protein